jgi:stage II sporulation protein D
LDWACGIWIKIVGCKTLISLFCLIISAGCAERPYVTITPQMDAEQKYQVRVLLLDNVQNCSLLINRPFIISDPQTRTEFARFGRLGTPVNVAISASGFVIAGKSINADRINITPDAPYAFNLNGDDFRGKLTLVANIPRTAFDVINIVPLEPYLAGVIGAEIPNYWEPEELKAQAIAARTYCLYIKKRFGPARNWDVSRTVTNQVYRGIKAESSQVWNAVNSTTGQILVVNGTGELFPAYYSSACGGHTENSQNVFGEPFRPLGGVPCPYCADIAKPDRFFWPAVQVEKSTVSERLLRRYPTLQPLGKIVSIATAEQTNYTDFSRLTMIKLIGSTGNSDTIRAEDMRLTIDPTGTKLKSMICRIGSKDDKWIFTSGRGYGHGVGLCQCGAEGMARQGKTASEILAYYYPGSKIARAD